MSGHVKEQLPTQKSVQLMEVGADGEIGTRVSVIIALELELETEQEPVLILYHHAWAG